MTYEIKWEPQPRRFLVKLPRNIAIRIWKKLGDPRHNPSQHLEHYEGAGLSKLRVGDYRALISVEVSRELLILEVLDKRRRIYKG